MEERIKTLREKIIQQKLNGLLITDLANLRYLIGYTGDNGMLILTKDQTLFFTDFRYEEQSKREIKNAKIIIRPQDLFTVFPVEEIKGIKKLGFEENNLTYRRYFLIKAQVPKLKLFPVADWVSEMRAVKAETELKLIRKAIAFNDKVFNKILEIIKPGLKEKEIAAEINYLISQYGEPAFPTIVAAGRNGALPHYEPGQKKLKKGDPVVLDFGTRYQGYCSDMTRTVFIGKANAKSRAIYSIVLEAQARAITSIKQGKKASDIDAQARNYITEKGYGKYFGHSLGHGVGLMVHEGPVLAKTNRAALKANNVVTVEPGIYLPDWGGVRIEDMVRVTKTGCEILTKSSKALMEL